jgi:tetratricopeptide (TPR) repeat protein
MKLQLGFCQGVAMSCRLAWVRLLSAAAALSIALPSSDALATVPAPAPTLREPEPRVLPGPDEFSDGNDQALLSEIARKLSDPDVSAALPALDASLAKLREPSRMRGMVQFFRASILLSADRYSEAADAIEESIRLLPGYSGPLLAAASIYAYSNQPGKGADYFLRASQIDPATVRMVDDYEIQNIVRRLRYAREKDRSDAISDRLLEIGWIGSDIGSRSGLAKDAIERRLSNGDVEGARALVSKLLIPSHSYSLLVNKDFSAVWPDIESWAGPQLHRQWATYLREARDRWAASKNVSTVRDYATALIAAGHDRTVIRDVLPHFNRRLERNEDQDLQFVVTGVAGALAREGRWEEVQQLFERAQEVWPLSSENVNSLNITANWARYLMFQGKYATALAKMDQAIGLATKWQVNPDAVAAMHHYRACMLHELGRGEEAGVSVAIATSVEFPDDVAELNLCTGNPGAARRIFEEALKSDTTRTSMLLWAQKNSVRTMPSDWDRKMHARINEIRSDPKLRTEVDKVGRILPYALRDGAPPEMINP